jgi:hypothetical protein
MIKTKTLIIAAVICWQASCGSAQDKSDLKLSREDQLSDHFQADTRYSAIRDFLIQKGMRLKEEEAQAVPAKEGEARAVPAKENHGVAIPIANKTDETCGMAVIFEEKWAFVTETDGIRNEYSVKYKDDGKVDLLQETAKPIDELQKGDDSKFKAQSCPRRCSQIYKRGFSVACVALWANVYGGYYRTYERYGPGTDCKSDWTWRQDSDGNVLTCPWPEYSWSPIDVFHCNHW